MGEIKVYEDLPFTKFPVDVDTFEDMQDVSLDTYNWVKQYNEYFIAGNIKSAQALLSAHPEFERTIFNALKINRLNHAIEAMERFYKEDMTLVVQEALRNAIGINDNPTLEQSKVSSYSGYKIEQNLQHIKKVKNTLLSADGWSETAPYEQTVQVEGILETDSPFIECAEDVLTKEEKKLYRKQWDKIDRIVTGNGQITAYCYFEKPTLSLEIRIKGA